MKKRILCITAVLLAAAAFHFSGNAPTPAKTGDSPVLAVAQAADAREVHVQPGPVPVLAASTPERTDFAQPDPETADSGPVKWEAITAFDDWTARYVAAAPQAREAMVVGGVALAEVRRPQFKKLINTDPRAALAASVPRVVRQELPQAVASLLEKPVSARGEFKAYFGRPAPGVELPPGQELTLRYFETPEKSYRARVFGALTEATSRKDVAMRGVAIDREFAVAESPVRQLESGERIEAGTALDDTCPVSGNTTPTSTEATLTVDDETPVVELAGRLIRLCNGTHVRVFEEAQILANGPGGAGFFKDTYPGTSAEAIGNFRCLYIRVTYPDQMRAPNTEATALDDMRNVSRFYLESSFGRMTTTSNVTPLIVLPHTKAWYIAKDSEVDGLGLVHSHSRSEARKLGFDSNQFNCTIVRVNEGPRLSGISWGGGDSVWVSWNGMDVLNHECGHSLGRNHANFWTTSDGSAIGVGSNQEYGNSYDVMGGGGGFGAHYNTISKRALGWLPDNYVHRSGTTPSYNGVYRIYAYDQPQLEEGRRYALRVNKDPQRQFYLEYHPAVGGKWPDSVLMLINGLGSNCGHLIDTTPGSSGGKGDGGIRVGRTFSDFESDLHFTVLSKNATTPVSMDVAMMRGPFPGNLPPTASFTASATSITVNGSATFTATASDPNGDALAYHWDFSDGAVTTNTPVFTRSFTSADQQTVSLTVSDMKGGIARAHKVITIGSPNRGVVTGRIVNGTTPVVGVLVTSDNSKYAFTDSNGDYAIADLTSGARTLTATLTGYTFTADFANPITAISNSTVSGANWTAASVTELSITATDATEGGSDGSFVFTRTGDTTAALDVLMAPPVGSATKTTDYTFSPDSTASSSLVKWTIPAGQASLTVTVAAANDTAQEGPETVQLQPAPGAYQVRTSGIAFITVVDDDTTRPVVSIAATDIYATETAGDAGEYTVSRTGPTTDALNVTVAYSGTATRGSDYPNLSTTVTIPSGQSATALSLAGMDDTAIETPEDAIVTVSSNANYIVSPNSPSATVTITDNDLATVTVVATDDTLMEAGRDPGAVLITRSGNLSQPLKVYYGLSGRALHGTDYIALPGEVTIPAGLASVPVILTPYDDAHGEVDESITFNLTGFDNAYSMGSPFSATLTIKDNADAPLVTVTANSASEPSTNGTFTFTTASSASGNITVNYTLSGTATAGSDFTSPSGSVSVPANGSATVSIPVINDAVAENTETIVLTMTPDAGYTVYNDGFAVMRLKDDDSDAIAASIHSATLAEPSSASSFYLSRGGSTGDLTVNYVMSGSATNGTDYATLSGTATILDGATGVDVAVAPTDDALAEGTETITLTVVPGTGYGLENESATLYLGDNDSGSMPSVGFASATGTTSEGLDGTTGEYRDIEVTLSPAQTGVVTAEFMGGGGTATGDDVDWAFVTPANVVIPRGIVTFPAGNTSQIVRIRVKNDGVAEGSETAILELRNVNNARLSTSRNKHTLTITDTDLPLRRVRFAVAATTRGEASGNDPMLMAVLDRAPTSGTISVSYSLAGTATQGQDYNLPPGTLTFAVGETIKPLPLVILADSTPELSETIIVTLTDPVNSEVGDVPTHTVTLTESNVPIVSIAVTGEVTGENGQAAALTISRTGSTSLALTVNYSVSGTAAGGSDYTALPGSVVIPIGQSSATFPVTPLDDSDIEPNETVIISLASHVDYAVSPPGEATVTIVDDDAPPALALLSPLAPAVAVPSGVGLICQADATRQTAQGFEQVPVAWSAVSGPGTPVIESPASNTTGITFPVAGLYIVRVSAGTAPAVSSKDIFVSVGAANYPMRDVGTTGVAGSVAQSGGTYTLTGAGTGISSTGTSDGFYFASVPVTGDFDVNCRVVSFTNPGEDDSHRMGIMARDGLAANALYAMTMHRGNGVHVYQYRTTVGTAPGASGGSTSYTMPRYVRLKRTGNVFAAYYSADGVAWSQRGSDQTIAMGPTCHLGLALTSAESAIASTAVFDSLNFAPVTNVGPNVSAGAALTGNGPWTTSGSVTDDAKPAGAALSLLWNTASGAGNAAFADATAAVTGVTFPNSGAYTLRLTASDTHTTTFADTTANVSTMTPWDVWRESQFTPAELADPLISGEDADPDGDEYANLAEFWLGLSPKTPNAAALKIATAPGGERTITYTKEIAATDVTAVFQKSTTLAPGSWQAVTPTADDLISTAGSVQTRVATLPLETAPAVFYHIKFTKAQE